MIFRLITGNKSLSRPWHSHKSAGHQSPKKLYAFLRKQSSVCKESTIATDTCSDQETDVIASAENDYDDDDVITDSRQMDTETERLRPLLIKKIVKFGFSEYLKSTIGGSLSDKAITSVLFKDYTTISRPVISRDTSWRGHRPSCSRMLWD